MIPFSAEHDWLLEAVALGAGAVAAGGVVQGRVQDGVLTPLDGSPALMLINQVVVHAWCHQAAGRPTRWLWAGRAPHGLEDFCQQLFDFAALVAAGQGWMLSDPSRDSPDGRRNRQGIELLLERARS